jgi:ABC-type multidrug transport system permease subunit
MKIGTFPEAFNSLKDKYSKNVRTLVILAWFLFGQILGTICWYFYMRMSLGRFMDGRHDEPSLTSLSYGSYLCLLVLPFIFMILGVLGILPGTRKKKQ